MNSQDSYALFSMAVLAAFVVGALSYAYSIWMLWNEPDPSTQYGISMNAMLAALFACVAGVTTLVLTLLFGVWGFVLSMPLSYLGLKTVMKKMIQKNDSGKTAI